MLAAFSLYTYWFFVSVNSPVPVLAKIVKVAVVGASGSVAAFSSIGSAAVDTIAYSPVVAESKPACPNSSVLYSNSGEEVPFKVAYHAPVLAFGSAVGWVYSVAGSVVLCTL